MAREGSMEEEDPYVMQSRLDTVNYKNMRGVFFSHGYSGKLEITETCLPMHTRGSFNVSYLARMASSNMLVEDYTLEFILEDYNRHITEMEGQIKKQEREVLSLQKLLEESDRYLELKSELERASGVEILDEGDGYLELRLTTHVPAVKAVRADFEEIYEHKLTVKLNPITMAIETAQLTPEDVRFDDLVSEVAKMSLFRDSSLVIYGGQEWCKQLPNLIARLRDRILKKHLSVSKD